MADNVITRDYNSSPVTMRATDKGTSKVPHHIVDDVSIAPVVSAVNVEQENLLSAAPCSLVELDIYCAANGFVYIFDLVAIPVTAAGTFGPGGAVTTAVPKKIIPVVAGNTYSLSPKKPIQLANGCWVVFSSAAYGSITKAAQCHFSAQLGAFTGEAS